MKKLFSILFAVVMCIGIFGTTVGAAKGVETTVSSGFVNEWEYTAKVYYGGIATGYMTYGYDTDWTNEDYVWTISVKGDSQAFVKRNGYDDNEIAGPSKGAGTYSKIEVTHRTQATSVTYSSLFYYIPDNGSIVVEVNPSNIK